MSRFTGYELMETDDGNLLQAGVKSRAEVAHLDVDNVGGWITRAVVLATYYADEDKRGGWVEGKQRCILCDVRTYGRYSRNLQKVPLLQRTHGLWDQDIYVPRGATIDTTGGTLLSEPSGKQGPTSADKLDGDHVLVGFLDNDSGQPVILPYQLPHPSSNYTPVAESGRVRRIRHNGVLVEWDKDGNLVIDATEAAQTGLKADGTEESNSGTGGQITLITSDGSNPTSLHLDAQGQVLLGSDPAAASDEPMVLGNRWIAVMDQILDQITALAEAGEALIVATAVGPSAPAGPVNKADFTAVKAAIAPIKSDIDGKTQVSDFIFGKKAH